MLSITNMNCIVFYLVLLIFKCALALDEKCTRNSDCKTINSICIDSVCGCDNLSNNNGSQCLPYATEYGAPCYENSQCDWLGDNAECSRSRCVCVETFKWYQGKCQHYVDKGQECNNDDWCYNGYDMLSLTCSNGVCDCSTDNFYDRGLDCRKSSSEFGDCALTLDCQSSSLECVLGNCTAKSEDYYTYINEEYFEILHENEEPKVDVKRFLYGEDEISCKNDADCADMANSRCDISNKTCACNGDTHYLYNGNCVQGLSYCDENDNCFDVSSNTMCYRNSCICKRGFFLKDKKCIAELGVKDPNVIYDIDSDCPIKPGQAVDSICYCKKYWFNDAYNRNCIKTTIESTLSCLTNEWCSAMGPYSFCNSTTSTCQCSSVAKFNESTFYCDVVSTNPDICFRDTECDVNERCLDEKCECVDNFSRDENNDCVADIGGTCPGNTCSHIDHSYCLSGICQCDTDYIGKEAKCLKIADSLESPCEEQEQCQSLPHAVCGESEAEYVTNDYNDTLRCICEEGYTDVEDLCLQIKKYGDPCMTEAECTLVLNRSYKCKNNKCHCNVGLSLKNGYCTSSASFVTATSFLLWLGILWKLVIG